MYKLRHYQEQLAAQIYERLIKYKLCYLAGQVRIGKTFCALGACQLFYSKKVLFLTKKKAMSSIQEDYEKMNYSYSLTVINYESIHKIESNEFDVIILDEAHSGIAAYPKKSKRTKQIKERFSKIPMILLSGTPAVESGSQWYHQFYVSDYSPFKKWTTFYKWAKDFVNIVQIDYGYGRVNNYDNADRHKIQNIIDPYLITFTQKEAGFITKTNEKILYFDQDEKLISLSERLIKDRVIEGNEDVILADTSVKLQSKIHQIQNGSCILESGKTCILSKTKMSFIKDSFKDKKILIYYYFKAELEIIKQVYGNEITTDLQEFNDTKKSIAIQQSSSEGMNLSKAEAIIFYNFGFSGVGYIQSRERMTVLAREHNQVYFVFAKGGINEKIYRRIKEKLNYNIKQFKKDFGIKISNTGHSTIRRKRI